MTIASDSHRRGRASGLSFGPIALLALAVLAAALLLLIPMTVPIGPMYWDLFIYFDAANRIFDGQMPAVDFFAPVGPLGYYLFAWGIALFPDAQPLLLSQWSLLAVTAPLMALVLADVGQRSRGIAFALLIPFLVFALLPFNNREFYPYPGSDGFGIYNRQVTQVLYLLVAGLLFVKGRAILVTLVTACMLALFTIKITGFISGGLICLYAFAAARLTFRQAAAAAAAFLATLGLLELTTGMVSAYVRDIYALVADNTDALAPRMVQAVSLTFGVVAPAGALVLLLLWQERPKLAKLWRQSTSRLAGMQAILDRPALWLAVVVFAGIFFEAQNTGSQAMIMVWPVLLVILMKLPAMLHAPARALAIAALAAACFLPLLVNTTERAARAYAGALKNVTLQHDRLKTLGTVNMRPEIADRADTMMVVYAEEKDYAARIVESGHLPSPMLYQDFDFQIIHMRAIGDAVIALEELEANTGLRFETMMNVNFVNPFPWLMDRSAPRRISIGADPSRTVPPPDEEALAAVRDVDIALMPTCPLTTANAHLFEIYGESLADHRLIELTPCFDALVHPRLADRLD
ncbi:hypothetical protein GRZ55_20460 [Chelativorans sp. ZYF759]|uniref:hypothetical protein n=1 Tax=Chelativorans sp. ZYF759 TaxID=2692213 RepID=UPI00145E8E92|nr:hypothetical protein [Chelativorans sp. ZYF759]NMG41619.1 hypothetical protein [Chelativorans sp. ZYF759]